MKNKIKLIAETAWHHQGDINFYKNLITQICKKTNSNYIKLHITSDVDNYMLPDHAMYKNLRKWHIPLENYANLISIIRKYKKLPLILVNDEKCLDFCLKYKINNIEIHSALLSNFKILEFINKFFDKKTNIFGGISGCSDDEINFFLKKLKGFNINLIYGFQSYPTNYQDINLNRFHFIINKYKNFAKFGFADHCGYNEKNNSLITLIGSTYNVDFIEKHVTIEEGKKRCDYESAVSIKFFKDLEKKIIILNKLVSQNHNKISLSERNYGKRGIIKAVAVVNKNLIKDEKLIIESIDFRRTSQLNGLLPYEIEPFLGKKIKRNLSKNSIIKLSDVK